MRTYVKDCMHGKFLLLHGDMISEYVNLYGEWCEPEVKLYARLLEPASRVVEIGANIGMHTVPLAKLCHAGQVLCFEPQRVIFQMLNANVALNNLVNVHAHRLALGASAGVIEIDGSDYSTPWNYGSFSVTTGFSSENKFNGAVKAEKIAMKALDQVDEIASWPRLDLLKVDVEGAEQDVLRGAARTIHRHKPAIFIENNNAASGDKLIEAFQRLDYRPFWFVSNRYRKENFNQAAKLMASHDINMLCLPKDRPLPAGLDLVPATHFAQIKAGLPIYG